MREQMHVELQNMLCLFALSMLNTQPHHKGSAALHVTKLAVHNFSVVDSLEAATAAAVVQALLYAWCAFRADCWCFRAASVSSEWCT